MIRRSAFGLVLLLPFLLAAQAPPPANPWSAADKVAVEKLINGYFQAFTDKSYEHFRECFGDTFIQIGGHGSVITRALDDTIENYRMLRESLSGTDYAVSKVAEMKITALAGDRALADLHWQRLKKDGSLFGEGAELLLVSKSSGTWKIYGQIPQNLVDFGKLY